MRIPQKPPKLNDLWKGDVSKITSLLHNKDIIEFIADVNKRYLHWDELRYKKIPQGVKPEYVWALIKMFRSESYKKLSFANYKFNYSLLDDTLKSLHALDKGSAGYLESESEFMNIEGKDRYIISSLMEEAIASSQLEGAVTTHKVAKEILKSNKKARDYSERMIINDYKTMQKIIKIKNENLTPEIILEIHKEITEDTLKDKSHEGSFREDNEVVVGDNLDIEKIYHIPPDYQEVNKLMVEFCKFANEDNGQFIHPIIKGIILHYLIGYIHPFNDGNGRTARTIFYWYVIKKGYWLFEFMSISRILLRSKTKYGLAYLYTESDDDLTYFIKYNIAAVEEAFNEMKDYINRKQKEQSEAMKFIKEVKEINLRQAEIIKELMKNPKDIITIADVKNTYGVAYDTARNDLLHLVELDYLEKTQIKKKFVFRLKKKK